MGIWLLIPEKLEFFPSQLANITKLGQLCIGEGDDKIDCYNASKAFECYQGITASHTN